MQDIQYKVVFSGQIMPGMTLETVKDNLAQLFKSDRSRIDGLFGKGPVAFKRELREDEADKYLGALQRAGAQAHKEVDFAASLTLIDSEPAEDAKAAVLQTMECPKCGHSQPASIECGACGIVIEKYLARQAQLKEQVPAQAPAPVASPSTTIESTPSPYAPPQASVATSLPVGELKPFTVKGRIGRLRYLAWSMVALLAMLPLFGLAAVFLAFAAPLAWGLFAVIGIAYAVVNIQIGVQRLHDIGWTGWLYALNVIPVVGYVFPFLMLIMPGTDGDNRFGPPQPANSKAVKILACLWLLFPVVGGLAMIALP